MEPFFIDTADVTYIKNLWENRLSWAGINPKKLVGFTTNPNAIAKVNVHSIEEFKHTISNLSLLLNEIRGDKNGLIYVQGPSSKMSVKEKLDFLDVAKEASSGLSTIGLKITPYFEDIENLPFYNKNEAFVNVTGIADCSTALACIREGYTRFISIIPGRMEEAGIDAKEQIRFVMERNFTNTEVIAGSMRTLDGLKWTIEYGCVPTIGTRVWDSMTAEQLLELNKWHKLPFTQNPMEFSPVVTKVGTDLSVAFFKQMDEMGERLYESWNKK